MATHDRAQAYVTDPATSKRMAAVRPVDTTPEVTLRKILTAMRIRYRLHGYRLPGRPDVVLSRRRKVIFVHGCYWHRHPGCPRATTPARNRELWEAKFQATVERDQRHLANLTELGWEHLVLWECQIKPGEALEAVLSAFLGEGNERNE